MTATDRIDRYVTHHQTVANGVRLHYVEAGPDDGDLVVFLHGFPEFWGTWRRQLVALADAGYRVVAPDLRGYNRSEKPHGLEAYRLETLTADVEAVIRALRSEDERDARSAHVVAHDWGGMIAWATALSHPHVIDRLVVLNAPHPIKFVHELTLSQAARSWYAAFIQLPWLPERLLAARDYRALEELFRDAPVRPDAFTDEDVRRFKRAAAQPGALESAINYYRAFARGTVREHLPGSIPVIGDRLVESVEAIDVPTLVLWGERDSALALDQLDGLERYVDDLQVERFPDASHWVHADRPDQVNESILDFLE
ncbi:alpha/beta hydrolase [Halobacteria archaeon AArc-m2/3/4]|uniref:Alpha/beta hydrolase n=1 Tax=Natronoglomus mannanivorans TaxID=2979990 RepID=A0AAP2YXI5_9EURY|nr:alpha/beta hydrolase [Halobacteria archaeon AArc-xg1-1]MCU4972654.1 alpha/beta hydrolase [Halobacteria archaeon AArc-m2/3/4]